MLVDILNNDRCHGIVELLNNDRCHGIVDVVNYDRCFIYKVCNRRTEQCLSVASWIILFDSLSCMSHSCNTRPPYRVCPNVSSKWNPSDSVIYNSRYTSFLLIYIATNISPLQCRIILANDIVGHTVSTNIQLSL